MQKDEQALSLPQIAEALGMARTTLVPMVNERIAELTVIETPGGQRRFYQSEVKALLERPITIEQPLEQEEGPELNFGETKLETGPVSYKNRIEYKIVNESGKSLGSWGTLPTDEDLDAAYGPGRYRILKYDVKTQQIIGATKVIIESNDMDDDPMDKALDQIIKMSRLSNELKGNKEESNSMMEILKLQMSENQELRKLILMNNQQLSPAGGSGNGQLKDFLSGVSFAKEISSVASGSNESPGVLSQILEIVREVVPAVAERILDSQPKAVERATPEATTAIQIKPRENTNNQTVQLTQE